ncbi:tungstate ABC transporter permease [Caldalkalibacillus thermarum TA2.A1]|uniref:Substrate-binding domain-containing protein n=1 Tax=Caldalkalibacillus thermarum (strain TA2.A1) TaxID=986075 RepID=F5L3D3_CALTT|nr:substrate-binding domain-containing protein [Caldalkalibacillus thermarum]EGL84148.1 tungstate ABC transporter permease [Caldalkalibacillus thermarum TA2.A1]QZT33612.1 substrate-binding domain-containing protein [Caldalkalibacillus thermarum TA2.A1]
MKVQRLRLMLWGTILLLLLAGCQTSTDDAGSKEMILATTTSTQDSGLLDELLPLFEEKTGYIVKTIAVGTGQALAMGEQGEADALLTHAPDAEQELERSGDVINRKRVMYNDFIIIGPVADPAGIKGLPVDTAFKQIADANALFISRGDDSGTHKKELSIWESTGIDPQGQEWYVETGQGMGDTLNVAAEREGYTLTDRGTYLAFKQHLDNMEVMVEGDESLLNIYHVMQVNPEKSEMINSEAAEAFVSFMVSEEVQHIIASFGVDTYGEPLFFPYAE